MVKILILICYARAVEKKPSGRDLDRPLARHGLRRANEAAVWLSESVAGGGWLFCSPARRALETAEVVAEMLQIPCKSDDRLYEASCEDLLAVVRSLDDSCGRVLLTGHTPGLSQFLRYLTDEPHSDLPAGGVAVVDLPVASWFHVSEGCGKLKDRFSPRGECTGFGHPALSRTERFRNWRFAKAQRLEIIAVLIVGLLLLLLLIPLVMRGTTDQAGVPQQGSSSP